MGCVHAKLHSSNTSHSVAAHASILLLNFLKRFFFSVGVSQAELFEAVRRRRGRSRSEDEEEDLGLPSSPYGVSPSTTADEHNNLVSALLLV